MTLAWDGVWFAYGRQREILRGISFGVQAGTITAILGPNGLGKTTLLHLALGWLHPSRGRVLVQDRPVGDWGRRELARHMSLVPQDEHIPFEYSVLEYVLLGRSPHLPPLDLPGPADLETAQRALGTVGLESMARMPIVQLSSGEKQLALLARSLAQDPKILLLDEPTSHLDPANGRKILDLVERLRAEGVTVLLTTHDPNLALRRADQVVLLAEGCLVAAGAAKSTLTPESLAQVFGVEFRFHADGSGRWIE